MSLALSDKNKAVYTASFCEENVWWLCKHLEENGKSETLHNAYALFISNSTKTVPIWNQKASERPDGLVIWDYHVVFYLHNERQVFDLDTTLPYPCTLDVYATEALHSEESFKDMNYSHRIRAVSAKQYLEHFASDRSHMLRKDGSWIAAPPVYPPISAYHCTMNLHDYTEMDTCDSPHLGKVYTLQEFLKHFIRSE